jgi:hypothetical protein
MYADFPSAFSKEVKIIGVMNASSGVDPRFAGTIGSYYPAYGISMNEQIDPIVHSFSFTDIPSSSTLTSSATGFDDWHDGSGVGDLWGHESVGANAYRGAASYIMIK